MFKEQDLHSRIMICHNTVIHQNKTPSRSNLLEKGSYFDFMLFQGASAGLRDIDFLNSSTTLVLNEVSKKELR